MAKHERIILIDADVVSHFIAGGEIIYLPRIFPNKIKILDKVYRELEKFRKKKQEIDNLLNFKLIELMDFPEENPEIKKEYVHIKKMMFKGDGEAACLAVVRYTNNIIGSSNLKDIEYYCKMHQIDYLTTMDFLCRALNDGLFDLNRCNSFIHKVLNAGSKLPVSKMEDYRCRELLFH